MVTPKSNINYAKTNISHGKDYNFFSSTILSGATYYDRPINGGDDGYECNVIAPISGQIVQIKFTVSSAANIYVSFNGTTDHLHLVADGGIRKEFVYPHLQKLKFWFRGTGTIEIELYV